MASKRLEKPKLPQIKICLWEDLTFSGMDKIDQASTVEEIKQVLQQSLCIPLHETRPGTAILLDLYVHTVQFAKDSGFNKEQTSAFFSIVRRLHEACTGSSLSDVDECFTYFSELVFCHAVRRPPFSIDLFNTDQVQLMIDYVLDTYFRHFKLYKYAFTPQIRMDVCLSYLGMPKSPPAIDEGVLVDLEQELSPADTELEGALIPLPAGDLRQYISTQLAEQVAELKTSIEGRIRAGEQELNLKLTALEKPGFPKGDPKSPKGKKK